MSTADRVKLLVNKHNQTQKKFAENIGITPARLNNYLAGLSKVPQDILIKISERYQCSLQWLLTGEGEMYNVRPLVEPAKKATIPIDIIPDIAAGTGYDCSFSEPLYTLQMPSHLLHRPGPFYGFRVSGDSMAPDIKEGDVVILSGNWEGLSLDGLLCGFRNHDGMILKRLVLDHHKKEGWLFSTNQSYKPIRYTKHTPDLVMIGVLCALIRDYQSELNIGRTND